MSKTVTTHRRSKWLSLPTPDPFSRLCARTTNGKAGRSRKGAERLEQMPDQIHLEIKAFRAPIRA
jgi:hypothetical protein